MSQVKKFQGGGAVNSNKLRVSLNGKDYDVESSQLDKSFSNAFNNLVSEGIAKEEDKQQWFDAYQGVKGEYAKGLQLDMAGDVLGNVKYGDNATSNELLGLDENGNVSKVSGFFRKRAKTPASMVSVLNERILGDVGRGIQASISDSEKKSIEDEMKLKEKNIGLGKSDYDAIKDSHSKIGNLFKSSYGDVGLNDALYYEGSTNETRRGALINDLSKSIYGLISNPFRKSENALKYAEKNGLKIDDLYSQYSDFEGMNEAQIKDYLSKMDEGGLRKFLGERKAYSGASGYFKNPSATNSSTETEATKTSQSKSEGGEQNEADKTTFEPRVFNAPLKYTGVTDTRFIINGQNLGINQIYDLSKKATPGTKEFMEYKLVLDGLRESDVYDKPGEYFTKDDIEKSSISSTIKNKLKNTRGADKFRDISDGFEGLLDNSDLTVLETGAKDEKIGIHKTSNILVDKKTGKLKTGKIEIDESTNHATFIDKSTGEKIDLGAYNKDSIREKKQNIKDLANKLYESNKKSKIITAEELSKMYANSNKEKGKVGLPYTVKKTNEFKDGGVIKYNSGGSIYDDMWLGNAMKNGTPINLAASQQIPYRLEPESNKKTLSLQPAFNTSTQQVSTSRKAGLNPVTGSKFKFNSPVSSLDLSELGRALFVSSNNAKRDISVERPMIQHVQEVHPTVQGNLGVTAAYNRAAAEQRSIGQSNLGSDAALNKAYLLGLNSQLRRSAIEGDLKNAELINQGRAKLDETNSKYALIRNEVANKNIQTNASATQAEKEGQNIKRAATVAPFENLWMWKNQRQEQREASLEGMKRQMIMDKVQSKYTPEISKLLQVANDPNSSIEDRAKASARYDEIGKLIQDETYNSLISDGSRKNILEKLKIKSSPYTFTKGSVTAVKAKGGKLSAQEKADKISIKDSNKNFAKKAMEEQKGLKNSMDRVYKLIGKAL